MLRRTVFALIGALAVLLACAASASAAPLKAGAARADITPANGGTTLGYVRPDITVKGVHTRLLGRALVLDDGDSKVALLATDLAFALEKESLVARLKDLGFTHENILYTARTRTRAPRSWPTGRSSSSRRRSAAPTRARSRRGRPGATARSPTPTATARSRRTSRTSGWTSSTARATPPTRRAARSRRATPGCACCASSARTARRSRRGWSSPCT
jgi:hypothetical protein